MNGNSTQVADELRALQNKQGMIVPRDAVEWARKHPGSRLHAELDWNDTEAAENWRIWQVRRLVAIHVVSVEGTRELVSLSIDRGKGGGYRYLRDVAKREDLIEVLLQDALAELKRLQAKFSAVQALAGVWREANRVEQEHTRRTSPKRPVPKKGRRKAAA